MNLERFLDLLLFLGAHKLLKCEQPCDISMHVDYFRELCLMQ